MLLTSLVRIMRGDEMECDHISDPDLTAVDKGAQLILMNYVSVSFPIMTTYFHSLTPIVLSQYPSLRVTTYDPIVMWPT
jgi:hypothetical protein